MMTKETMGLLKKHVNIDYVMDSIEPRIISAHSHGAKELIGYELEVVLPLDIDLVEAVINHTIGYIYENKMEIVFNKVIEPDFMDCRIQLMECDFGEKDKTIRIIFADGKNNFPDKTNQELYKYQTTINTVIIGYREVNAMDNKEKFKKELEGLCLKYNVRLFAGMRGIVFDFMDEDKEDSITYYDQNKETKELIKVEKDFIKSYRNTKIN